jgi:peptidoglycan/LPS O-acetylase OafA/YrhL
MPLGYMPQLDGLRALAVLAVAFEHYGIKDLPIFRWFEWGRLGVWLFFVLSGFLITEILLKSGAEIHAGRRTAWDSAKVFYIRRFLRILPVYYVTLAVAALCLPDVRHLFLWHVTYTTDFWTALHPGAYPYGIHFWTLAIEEQFYLVWPWVILLTPRRFLPGIATGCLIVGVAYRAAYQAHWLGHSRVAALGLPTVGNIDKFACGALLALATVMAGKHGAVNSRISRVGLWIGLPALLFLEALNVKHPRSPLPSMFVSAAAALFFSWVIARAAAGFAGPVGHLFQSRFLTYPGKISYGLYLFHPFVPLLLATVHVPLPHSVGPRFVIYSAAAIALASISWYGLEAPINALKSWFPYSSRPSQTMASSAPLATSALMVEPNP